MDPKHKEHMITMSSAQGESKKSPVITKVKYDAIVKHLRNLNDKVDAHFRHWVKGREFKLLDMPALGLSDTLVVPKKNDKQTDTDSRYLKVLHADQMYETILQIHSQELKHAGYKKVLEYVSTFLV